MSATYEIRADYDKETIVVYQAYGEAIALPAIRIGTFQPPFSLNRMTWIKPSFLWMMERSNWGLKSGQEYVFAIRITRKGWEEALSHAVLTSFERTVYRDDVDWRDQFKKAIVHVQWDPERTLRGQKLEYRSIQVGLSRHIVERYVNEWIVEMQDCTKLVRKIHDLRNSGDAEKAAKFLPKEKVYSVEPSIGRRLGML